MNIARTTLSSKILTQDKEHFAELAVESVLRLRGSTDLEAIHILKKPGGTLPVSPSCLGLSPYKLHCFSQMPQPGI